MPPPEAKAARLSQAETAVTSARADLVPARGRVLLADDDLHVLRAYGRALSSAGHTVQLATNGREAIELIRSNTFDVIVSDISMPGMDGVQLLRNVRDRDFDVPVILMTASPAVDTAVKAVEYGALRYLIKPLDLTIFQNTVGDAIRLHQLAKLKREALSYLGRPEWELADRAGLETSFERALASIWMAYQPIVSWPQRRVFGHEALLRTKEPTMPHPGAILGAAERLSRLDDLGRAIRASVAGSLSQSPDSGSIFVNLHSHDLLDGELYSPSAPLSSFAQRVILEITERATLDEVSEVGTRVAKLRALGYRIAVDDLGAGYAGLSSFAVLEPEVVKLDISLIRNVHAEPTKRKLIGSMASLCREMGLLVVAEGVETIEERNVLENLGCDLLQGYLFARPGKLMDGVTF